jgi:tRNA (guanine-N7-)-methyltransferase
MPHIKVSHYELPQNFPITHKKVTFVDLLDNHDNNHDDQMMLVEIEDKALFLELKRSGETTLIKINKQTRISPTFLLHQTLYAFIEAFQATVVHDNLTDHRNIHLDQNESALKPVSFFTQEYFNTPHEIWLEIGFGSGRHLLHQASEHPEILFIGIELHKPSIEQMLKQIIIQKLENIVIVDYDARLFLELVPSNKLGKIFLHFPVPWDKKPHRRVISQSFIDEALRTLKKDGSLEVRTDSDNYFAFTTQTMFELNHYDLHIRRNHDIGITSKYEARWKRQEKSIYDITLHSTTDSKSKEDVDSFSLQTFKNFETLHQTTHKFTDGFIHFERSYVSKKYRIMLLSMGSFNRPEHLFIVEPVNETPYYFPTSPVPTKTNHAIHTQLNGLLYE